jgi:NitT/TauT family transport system substrate-binding protein
MSIVRKWLAGLVVAGIAASAAAESNEIKIAQQYGVSFLPLMVMERDKLIEKHANAQGLGDVKVGWIKVAGPSVMNDGVISGALQFIAVGAPSMITLWDKTNGQVKGVSAMTTYPLYLISRNPAVRSAGDFSDKDRIAVPSIKVSTQAIMLQMLAAREFGDANYARFDPFTIALSHPDAVLALMNNSGGINAHFTSSPFYEQEMKFSGTHLVTTNYEILGGPATAVVIAASDKYREANPKSYRAFYDALKEAIDIINKDKRAAAKIYLEQAHDSKDTVEDIYAIISARDYAYTLTPQKVYKTAEFMRKIGTVKHELASWKDLFFPEVQGVAGD